MLVSVWNCKKEFLSFLLLFLLYLLLLCIFLKKEEKKKKLLGSRINIEINGKRFWRGKNFQFVRKKKIYIYL